MVYTVPREVAEIRRMYSEEVKPAIESGNYELAHVAMMSANFIGQMEGAKIERETHFGSLFLAAGRVLEERLKEGDARGIKSAQKIFEAYAAQTSVPGHLAERF